MSRLKNVTVHQSVKSRSKNIQLNFLNRLPVEYKQFGASFTPNLSIIDIMMFNGLVETKNMLSLYELN